MIRIDFKNVGLQLCTCIWIEIMTGLGISLYLLLMHNYTLSGLTAMIFTPLIVFHYVISRLSVGREEETCNTRSCGTSTTRLRFTKVP
jgi:hypothetical protein